MAALGIVASEVLAVTGAIVLTGTAGEAITAGQALYKKASDQLLYLADANGLAALRVVVGIALNSAAVGQPLFYTSGTINLGATGAPTAGVVYVLGTTPGAINPTSDIGSGWGVTVLGVGGASNKLYQQIHNSLQEHA